MDQRAPSFLSRVFSPGPTADHEPLPSSGKAGRNLPAAIISGVTLVTVVALALFLSRPVFLVLVSLLMLLASWEVAGALARRGQHVTLVPVYIGGLGMIIAGALGSVYWVMLAMYLTVFASVLWRIFTPNAPGRPIQDVMATIFTIVYIPFFGSFVTLMSYNAPTPWPLVFFVVVVVCSDLGGWMAGVLFGKHPMAPKLSPKKSWEGFAGSVALSTVAALIGTFVLGIPWWWCFIMGAAGALIGTLGDLTESLIKRDVGLKDMSSVVPGHGGIMDRLDSLLFAAPAFFLIYSTALQW